MQLVQNWKDGWRWLSNLAFTAIAAVNAVPLSPEVIHALPAEYQAKATITLALLGIAGRMIDQSKAGQAPSTSSGEPHV